MKLSKIEEVLVIERMPTEPLDGGSVRIRVSGIEDGTPITIYKNGNKDQAKNYCLTNGGIKPHVEAAKYTLCIGDTKVRFTVFEHDKKLYVAKPKEDIEKTVDRLYKLCIALNAKIEAQEQKLQSVFGYETE